MIIRSLLLVFACFTGGVLLHGQAADPYAGVRATRVPALDYRIDSMRVFIISQRDSVGRFLAGASVRDTLVGWDYNAGRFEALERARATAPVPVSDRYRSPVGEYFVQYAWLNEGEGGNVARVVRTLAGGEQVSYLLAVDNTASGPALGNVITKPSGRDVLVLYLDPEQVGRIQQIDFLNRPRWRKSLGSCANAAFGGLVDLDCLGNALAALPPAERTALIQQLTNR